MKMFMQTAWKSSWKLAAHRILLSLQLDTMRARSQMLAFYIKNEWMNDWLTEWMNVCYGGNTIYLQLFCNSKWKIVVYSALFVLFLFAGKKSQKRVDKKRIEHENKKNYKRCASNLMVRLGNLCLESFRFLFLSWIDVAVIDAVTWDGFVGRKKRNFSLRSAFYYYNKKKKQIF